MTLKKESRLARGNVAISIFRRSHDNGRMLSFDKLFTGRRILGPLFTEKEVCALLDILNEDTQADIDLSQSTKGHIKGILTKPTAEDALTEIRGAVDKVRSTGQKKQVPRRSEPKITIVSPMPKFTYAHTCTRCGCHIESYLRLGRTMLKLCPNCEHVHASTL